MVETLLSIIEDFSSQCRFCNTDKSKDPSKQKRISKNRPDNRRVT